MAAASGVTKGGEVTLYRSATVLADHAEATIEAAAISANAVSNVTDLGAREKSRNVITYNVYGEDFESKTMGVGAYADFTFDVAFDAANTAHVALRDDDGTTQRSFIVGVSTGSTNTTYTAIDGFISAQSLAQPFDGVATLSLTVAVTRLTNVDDS